MSCVAEALGMTLPGPGTAHAQTAKKNRLARQSGARIVETVVENLIPSKIISRSAISNAATVAMAIGGSTNLALHIPAIALEAGFNFPLETLEYISKSTRGPCIGHISPEAAVGGPIGLVEEGDIIEIDIPGRRLSLDVADKELAIRKDRFKPLVKPCSKFLISSATLNGKQPMEHA